MPSGSSVLHCVKVFASLQHKKLSNMERNLNTQKVEKVTPLGGRRGASVPRSSLGVGGSAYWVAKPKP